VTRVEFLHGASDRVQSAARWLRGAWEQRLKVVVYVPEADTAAQLDRVLWTQPAISFVPHCAADSPLAAETLIVLACRMEDAPHDACLLNLGNELSEGFSRYERLVEIVSTDDAVRLPARERFKCYRDRGYAIESRDISGEDR